MAVRVEVNGGERENANEWINFGMRVAVQGVLHPIEYAKVLIQVREFLNFLCCINRAN